MNLLLELHGNPGSAEDFDLLSSKLDVGDSVRVVALRRPAKGATVAELVTAIDRAIASHAPARVSVLAYSWGAWLALQHAALGVHKPDSLVLLNPYLVVERPPSPLVAALLGLPGIGAALIGAPRRARAFVETCFAPEIPASGLAAEIATRLTAAEIWRGALAYKRLPVVHAFAAIAPCPTLALVGAADRVAPWAVHSAALHTAAPAATVRTIEGAGHSLLWTHERDVVPAVRAAILR